MIRIYKAMNVIFIHVYFVSNGFLSQKVIKQFNNMECD